MSGLLKMDIDDVFIRTGEFGIFQWRAFIGFCLGSLFCGTQMVQNIFAGSIPSNMTCSMSANIDACDGRCEDINYNGDDFSSFATEWKMLCGAQVSAVHLIQSVFMAGVMTGSFFMGGLGDRFGRFPVMMACQLMCSVCALISSFANTYTLYAVIRFFTGFFLSGIIIVGFVLTSELVGPSKRGIVGTIPAVAFAVGITILSLTAWVTQHWRAMSVVLAVSGLVVTPLVYCLYEESPRWYLGKGNIEKCQSILQKIAKINGHDLGNINLKLPTSNGDDKGQGSTSMLSLFKNRILRKITVIQMISWFTVSAVYYGLTLASGDMGSNRYISVILSSLVEIPSNLIILYIMDIPRFGRVKSCVFGMLVSSVFCASIWFIPEEYTNVTVGMACAGKFFTVTAFAIVYVQAAELYPTPVRNVGLGLISIFNRVGGIMAPQIVSINNIYHNAHFMVFGVIGCLSGLLCLMLPETLGRPLPDSPEDIYSQVKKLDKNVVSLSLGDKQSLISDMIDDEEEMRA